MRFLFSTGSLFTYSVERVFAFAKAVGFDGIEVVIDQRWETRQAAPLQRLIDQHQLPIGALHAPFFDFLPGWPADSIGRLSKTIPLAETLRVPVIVHHLPARVGMAWAQVGGRMFPVPQPRNRDKATIQWLENHYADAQAQTRVQLCIENLPALRKFGRILNLAKWNTPQAMLRFDNITMDTTHLGTFDLDPFDTYLLWGKRVKHVHLSNFRAPKAQHLLPQAGDLDLARLLRAFSADNYNGAITLELQPAVLNAGSKDASVIEAMSQALDWCRAIC